MKKSLLLIAAAGILPAAMYGQGAVDGFRFSQPDLKGTARYMSMGGAFGALGGDLSTLSQNPAGIGVYRKHELGFTLNLDLQSSKSEAGGMQTTDNQTKFLLNNIGGVATWRFGNSTLRNINFGFTYNKAASFNRRYRGTIPQLQNSVSNLIAGMANGQALTDNSLSGDADPYYDQVYNANGDLVYADWLTILGYDSFLISPTGNPQSPHWVGQWGANTSGQAFYDVEEKGGINEYNIALGGNFGDIVYWGMDFGIINMNYAQSTRWSEQLDHAYVDGTPMESSDFTLSNSYSASGNGFNYKLGVIVKPIQQLRIGFAFHTPTWYGITETYAAKVKFQNPRDGMKEYNAVTNNEKPGYNTYDFRTPWRLIASVAGVISNRLIVSADYEWQAFNQMRFSDPTENVYDWEYDDWGWDWYYAPSANAPKSPKAPTRAYDGGAFGATNSEIRDYYQTSHTLRLGAEFRVTPQLSVRAGYSYVSSPVKSAARDNKMLIYTVGTNPSYSFDNTTNYVTCGLGYRVSSFYVDAAYVWKHRTSEFHAYTPDPGSPAHSPQAKIISDNSQVVLSMGFKF